ncbi:hypothetical protein MCEMAEM4_03362 [Burkholderiaceae bacterium]
MVVPPPMNLTVPGPDKLVRLNVSLRLMTRLLPLPIVDAMPLAILLKAPSPDPPLPICTVPADDSSVKPKKLPEVPPV